MSNRIKWDVVWVTLSLVFQDLILLLRQRNSHVHCNAGYLDSGPRPFSAWLSLYREQDPSRTEDLVISVRVEIANSGYGIQADISDGDGIVIGDWKGSTPLSLD